jgi:hypothetical protein
MRKLFVAGLAIGLGLLAACGGSNGGGSSDGGYAKVNTGIAIADFNNGLAALDPYLLFLGSEFAQAGLDLNGDADAADKVVHQLDAITGEVLNLGVAGMAPLVPSATVIGWRMNEVEQGQADFTADGDFADTVLVVHDPAQAVSVTNPLVTGANLWDQSPIVTDGDVFVFLTREFDLAAVPPGPPVSPPYPVGVDLTGDGDFDDQVVRIYNHNTGVLSDTGLASPDGAPFAIANSFVLFVASEDESGGLDLNGDGDADDDVLFSYDVNTLTVAPVGPGGILPRAVVPGSLLILGTSAQPIFAYLIDEQGEGGVNLNSNPLIGDTDADDYIIAIYDPATLTEYFPYGGIAVRDFELGGDTTRLAFVADEADNADTDFNTDGDAADGVPFWTSLADPTVAHNTGVAASEPSLIQVRGVHMLFLASEQDQGSSLNAGGGDTDLSDQVVFYLDTSMPSIPALNLGIASTEMVCSSDYFIIVGDESAQGEDLNEDGELNDLVPIFYSLRATGPVRGKGTILNDGPAVIQECPSFIRLCGVAFEGSGFGDRNSDDDEDDYFLAVTRIDRYTGGIISNSGAGTIMDENSVAFVLGGVALVYPSVEQAWGTGRNENAASGDTDFNDHVLWYLSTNCF